MLGEVAALVQHHLPEARGLDVLGTVHDVVAVAHHGTRLGLTDEARLGAVVVMRRIVVMGIVVLMMGIVIVMVVMVSV